MLKRTLVACTILCLSARLAYAGSPYLGGSLAVSSFSPYWYGFGFNLFGGYGGLIDQRQRIYLGGELNLQSSVLTGEYGYSGAAFAASLDLMPGFMVTPDTMIYSRLGVHTYIGGHYHYYLEPSAYQPEFGLGVQTKLNCHWDMRMEVVTQNHFENQIRFGVVYKFS